MSNYRDDREALRSRANALEEDLAAKEKELAALRSAGPPIERLDKLTRDLGDAQAEIARLREAYGPAPKRGRLLPIALGVASVAAIGFGAAYYSSRREAAKPQPPPPAAPTEALHPPQPVVVSAPAPAPKPTPVVEPAARSMAATWTAKVKSAKGSPLAKGTPCTISARILSDRRVHASGVSVKCGDTSLYASSDRFEGTSSMDSDVDEERGKDGFVRALTYSDKGERTGKKQVAIATRDRVARVWDDGATKIEIELEVTPFDAPTPDAFDPETTHRCARTTAPATVKTVDGRKDLKAGQRCTVATEPSDRDCKVTVKCGAIALYDGGFARFEDGAVVDDAPTASGGDPRLRIQDRSVELSDDGDPNWKITLERAP